MSEVMTKHKAEVQHDRCRVVCLACAWFHHDAAMDRDALRAIGRQHERNAERFEQEGR